MSTSSPPKAIVIGASSGIGYELCLALDAAGYQLGIAARRYPLLEELGEKLSKPAVIHTMDVTEAQTAMNHLQVMLADLGDVDLIVLNSGVAELDFDLEWARSARVIDTNVRGITALAGVAYNYFRKRGKGHLVGVSSIACLRGGIATSYNASKAYLSSYLEGLRYLFARQKIDVAVTDIRPGFVDTDIVKGRTFWMSQPDVAAQCILKAINRRKKVAYITPRWRLFAWLMKILPDWLYFKL